MTDSQKLSSILVCTDVSGSADAPIRTAAALADLVDAKLHVLYAFDLSTMPYAEASRKKATFPDRIAACEKALADQVERTVPKDVGVESSELVIRTPYLAILERSREVGAQLIVLGAHQEEHSEGILGSTAERVLRVAEAPCLLVRDGLTLPLRRILIPTDLSESGRAALSVGLDWDRMFGEGDTEIEIVHVAPKEFHTNDFDFGENVIVPELRKEMAEATGPTGSAGRRLQERLLWGDKPADAILQHATEFRPDLIVLGTHGQGVIKRALIGSVASTIARRAASSVLLIPPHAPNWNNDTDQG
jgi:universal stress protein E